MFFPWFKREAAGIFHAGKTFWKEQNLWKFETKCSSGKVINCYRNLCFMHKNPFYWAFQVCNSHFLSIAKYSDRVFCRLVVFKSYGNGLDIKWGGDFVLWQLSLLWRSLYVVSVSYFDVEPCEQHNSSWL